MANEPLLIPEPDPDRFQKPGSGSKSLGKSSPGRIASPTDVVNAVGAKTGETVRMAKRVVRGRDYLLAADGSGRVFKPASRLGAVELTLDELADFNGEDADDDE